MQIIHNFDISPREYHERGTHNNFPIIDICPCCSYPKRLTKHGFYWRYAVFFHQYFRIPILRFRCLSCDKTFSILPDFLLPYFQHSLEFVLECLREYFLKCTSKVYHQLLQFYRKRFLRNLNLISAFFRDKGYRGIVPEKNKAIKLLEMIGAFPKAKTLAKRFYDHFNRNFMAN